MKNNKKIHIVLAFIITLLVCNIVGFSNSYTASAFEQSSFEVDEDIEIILYEENLIMPMSSDKDFKKETDAVIPADTAGFSNRVLIPNADYYRARPNHGLNNSSGISGTCGEVAAQLTLSYHNYYSDRRIIENQYLFGSNNSNNEAERNLNPNFSTNPMPMTEEALGSNAEYHAHLNNNFGHLFGGTTLTGVRNGLRDELNRSNVSFTISSTGALWGLGILSSVSSTGIKAQIDVGCPVPVSIAKNLGAAGNHWVVAYGYQHMNGVFGYIVHYGWTGTDREFAWINANWASGYISLNINHTHNYNHIGGQWGERKCTECQHRQHPFIVNNSGVLTDLRYNDITGNIVIPDGIRIPSVNKTADTSITSIGSGVFTNQSQLSQISIPSTVGTTKSELYI